MKARMIVAAMALFVTIGLSAQTPQKTNQESRKSCYVDKNNNGICDKHEDGTCKVGNGKGMVKDYKMESLKVKVYVMGVGVKMVKVKGVDMVNEMVAEKLTEAKVITL